MLAHRDQENLVHSHQAAAASKPLNQNVKPLQPRTPGTRLPKTPFKVPLNDENDPLTFGKKTIRGSGRRNENAKPAKDAFQTPLETRSRAPLGMKTTNAKARGIQTPAPLGTAKPEKTNKRTSTQKVNKAAPPAQQQSRPDVRDKASEDDVPDIEYMPPKPQELPDIPDDITYDTSFPQFQPKNMALGLESVYGDNEVGPDGLTKRERKFRENSIACDKMVDKEIMKQVDSIGFNDSSSIGEPEGSHSEGSSKSNTQYRHKASAGKQRHASNVSTVKSRDAAAALSGTQSTTARTRPAPIPKPRVASSLLGSKKPKAPTNPSSMRPTAAVAGSKTTVGYSRGRSVSSKLPGNAQPPKEPAKKAILSPETYLQLYGPPPFGSEMWIRCKTAGCFEESAPETEEADESAGCLYEDEEEQNFQLTL